MLVLGSEMGEAFGEGLLCAVGVVALLRREAEENPAGAKGAEDLEERIREWFFCFWGVWAYLEVSSCRRAWRRTLSFVIITVPCAPPTRTTRIFRSHRLPD